MGLPLEKLGTTYGERRATVAPERARAYASATNDDNPAYESGKYAPPVFGVVPAWDAISLAVADVVPPEAVMTVVHGEQDMHFHQPLVPGASLTTVARAHCIRPGRSGTRFTVRVTSIDTETGEEVLEQYVTMVVRGVSGGAAGGPDKPDHAFPDAARAHRVGEHRVHVDADQTFRYSDASGDRMPIHLDDDVARAVGLPGIVVHGLCTMAMTSQAVLTTVAGGDPARLRRLAVRFSRPVLPDSDLVTTVYDAGPVNGRAAYAFESHSRAFESHDRSALVIANGWAEVEA